MDESKRTLHLIKYSKEELNFFESQCKQIDQNFINIYEWVHQERVIVFKWTLNTKTIKGLDEISLYYSISKGQNMRGE